MARACVDAFGIVWIGSYNRGLIRYDPMLDTYTVVPTGRRNNSILALAEGTDENGKHILWVGDDQGLGSIQTGAAAILFLSIHIAPFVRGELHLSRSRRDRMGVYFGRDH